MSTPSLDTWLTGSVLSSLRLVAMFSMDFSSTTSRTEIVEWGKRARMAPTSSMTLIESPPMSKKDVALSPISVLRMVEKHSKRMSSTDGATTPLVVEPDEGDFSMSTCIGALARSVAATTSAFLSTFPVAPRGSSSMGTNRDGTI